MMPHINILGTKVDVLTVNELHNYIAEHSKDQRKALILHANVYGLNLAVNLQWLREFYNLADIVFCDGAGVMLAARILGYRIPERITYADWMWQIGEFAADNSITFFFLGGRSGVAEKAKSVMQKRFPKLKIVGTHHGYFDKQLGSQENTYVIKLINQANPDILLVGFGMPLQEWWLMENWGQINARVALTGGAVFDYISGELHRGPKWMTDNGFEWLARLLIEPKRLWKRYILGNPLFLYRVLKQRLELSHFD